MTVPIFLQQAIWGCQSATTMKKVLGFMMKLMIPKILSSEDSMELIPPKTLNQGCFFHGLQSPPLHLSDADFVSAGGNREAVPVLRAMSPQQDCTLVRHVCVAMTALI